MELLSIAEAARLTGRHEKTLRRWIKRQLDTDPQAKEKIVRETIASGFSYRIDKDYLLTHSPTPLDSQPIQDTGQDTRQPVHPTSPIIAAKDETIALLKEQVKQQQEEMDRKNEQLKMVLERIREQNILLKGYQDRYLLESPKDEKRMESTGDKGSERTPEQYTVHPTGQGRQANSTVMDTKHQQKRSTEKQKGNKPSRKQSQATTDQVKSAEQPQKKGFWSFLGGK